MKSEHTLPIIINNEDAPKNDHLRRNTGNLDSWTVNAPYWDQKIGDDGNDMYQELVLPTMLELAELEQGADACILDLATGNGIGARALRGRVGDGSSSRVIATDGCNELLKLAQRRQKKEVAGYGVPDDAAIEYFHLNLMDKKQLEEFSGKYEQ